MAKPRLKFKPGEECYVGLSNGYSRIKPLGYEWLNRYTRTNGHSGEVVQYKYGEYQVRVKFFSGREEMLWYTAREIKKPNMPRIPF